MNRVHSQFLTYSLPNDITQQDLDTQVEPLLEELTLVWKNDEFVTFCYEDSLLYPNECSKNLIGLCSESIVLPEPYRFSCFRENLNKFDPAKIVIKTVNDRKPNVNKVDVIVNTYLDYSKVISYLETVGVVKTVASNCLNGLNKRRFMIVKDCPPKYVGKEYHVDFLGSALGDHLTSVIINLYKIYS